jgi:hypothetical protein
MNDPHQPILKAVAADKEAARLQKPEHVAQDLALKLRRRDVMPHRQQTGRRELSVAERHVPGITLN